MREVQNDIGPLSPIEQGYLDDPESAPWATVQQPEPTGRAMTTNAHEELYRVLLDSAELAPLNVLAQEVEVLATVLARRINDEMGEIDFGDVPY